MFFKEFLKKIIKEELLIEALTLSKAKEMTSIKRNPAIQKRLDGIFTKLANSTKTTTSKRGDRIYIPFGIDSTNPQQKDTEISSFLEKNGYVITDYKSGLCTDKYGRELKIGKVLTKLKNLELLNKFNNDKTRESAKNVNSYLVFAKHPYDIAGASTDRGWTSCMNLYTGSNRRYIKNDISEGTFVIYLISGNDLNIKKPIARILVKPYTNVNNEDDVLYNPGKIYGTAPSTMETTVLTILSKIQNEKIGYFKFIRTLYNDSDPDTIEKFPEVEKTKESYELYCGAMFMPGSWTITENIEVNYNGSLNFALSKDGPKYVKDGRVILDFNHITGDYRPPSGVNSLEGSPKTVDGNFDCSKTNITSLKHTPVKVGKNFECRGCNLTSLEGAPKSIGGNFDCSMNRLTSLNGGPKSVGKDFNCRINSLMSLHGAPKVVNGDFDCVGNQLTSLEGSPQKVSGNFICSDNNISSLEGAPKHIGKLFKADRTQIPEKELKLFKLSIM